MNDTTNTPVCERAPDLMAFLYLEMDERETREFRLHLQQCASCREELASFGVVRESISAWRDEALGGFVSTPLVTKKSAFAALRQFFDLSPLWLKAATGFAVIAFCVLAGLLFVNTRREPHNNAVYTQQDMDRLVKEALELVGAAGGEQETGESERQQAHEEEHSQHDVKETDSSEFFEHS